MTSTHIRQATIADLPALQKLNQQIMVNNPKYDDDLVADFAFTKEGESFFRDSIENPKGCCLIMEQDGKMVGYTDGEPKTIVYRKSQYFEINNFGVIPEMKGKGLGIILLDAIISWAKTKGFWKVYLSCYARNQEALAFYKKHGFSDIDVGLEKKI